MRCGKPDHGLGQKGPAKNAKCKDYHKIGHFHKVCQSKKRARQRANLVQTPPQDDDTHIDKNGVSQIHQGITGKAPQVSNHQTSQGTLQAPYSG